MTRIYFQSQHQYPTGFRFDAQFEAAAGVTALFGPSGAGKTTILGIIAGTLRPERGLVRLDEQVLLDTDRGVCLPPERRHVGCVFQDQRLFPHLSIEANLRYGLRRGTARSVDFSKVVDVLELASLLARYPSTLSGGQQQRVALGRAVLSGPKLLLLDEPLTALDASLKDRVVVYLDYLLNEWQIPTLFVSHDQVDVRRFAAQVVVVSAGRIVGSGPTASTLDQALLGGELPIVAPINLVRLQSARIDDGQIEGQIDGDPNGQRLRVPSQAAELSSPCYVRFLPSDVTLSRGPIAGISIRNQLRGTVRELVRKERDVFVQINFGQTIWAEITADAVAELGLTSGCEVTCLIKASTLQIVR
ncbi:MAG TPA: molybdenum ABC transporter ATP-binding protein [Lacipirellulaceae bacterium]